MVRRGSTATRRTGHHRLGWGRDPGRRGPRGSPGRRDPRLLLRGGRQSTPAELLIPSDAEIVREAAPESPHLLDAGEERLQEERVARRKQHVSAIDGEILLHGELFHGHAADEVLWNFHAPVLETVVHRSARGLVGALEPLDFVYALISP